MKIRAPWTREQVAALKRVARRLKFKPPDVTMSILTSVIVVTYIVANAISCRQLRLAERAAQLDQRAWLHAYLTSGPPQVGKDLIVTLYVANSGKTFARNVRLCSLFEATSDVPHRDPLVMPILRACTDTDWTAPNMIPPGPDWAHNAAVMNPRGAGAGLDEKQVEWLASGKMVVWHFGKITYDDIFDQHHWVTFCFARIVQHGETNWVTCNVGNDIDH